MSANDLIICGFADEIEKIALTAEERQKLKRGLTIGAATGLGVGTLKGLAEKGIETKLRRALGKKSKIPWAAARGLTSAGAGIAYTLGGLAAMGAFSKKKTQKAE